MNKKAFGKRINTARKEKRVTSEKLSEIVGKNAVFIRQIEGANKLPSLPTFVDICNALNVSPNYLLFDSIKDNAQDNVEEIIDNAIAHTKKLGRKFKGIFGSKSKNDGLNLLQESDFEI